MSPIANRAGPRASKAMGLSAWGIGLSLQVRRPTNQHSCSKVEVAGFNPVLRSREIPGRGRCQLALLLAWGGRKRQGPVGVPSRTRE